MSLPGLPFRAVALRLPLLGGLLAAAVAVPGGAALAAPATQAEMEVYTSLAALNLCIARAAGVEFERAVGIAAETITRWIQDTHQSAIAPVSATPLGLEDLRRGAVNSAVIGAVEICPDQVPPEVLRDVRQAMQKSAPATPTGQPPASTPAQPPASTPADPPARR
ncbi:cAMP phosphodiesterase [Cyanobium sp. CH-040]|uniref:cAMP phosphodiesterase n=1 Tax=Cyanobium sp. CH-040 TaxID=2823708 RepID=UPI0020CDCFB9|nr:cAMP phosphodiesterase [Cyanobium sp. CH-040]MCP9926558.1 cAMP phosphodiesterase [Cyanobium sp. CH-040]